MIDHGTRENISSLSGGLQERYMMLITTALSFALSSFCGVIFLCVAWLKELSGDNSFAIITPTQLFLCVCEKKKVCRKKDSTFGNMFIQYVAKEGNASFYLAKQESIVQGHLPLRLWCVRYPQLRYLTSGSLAVSHQACLFSEDGQQYILTAKSWKCRGLLDTK